MIKIYARNIFRFVVVILLQVIIFDNIELSGYLNPYYYVIFILLLPFEVPNWLLLVSAFFLGFTMDIVSLTPGMHTSATLFMAFLRPFVLQGFSPREGYDSGTYPRISYYGLLWFTKYAFILVLAHHAFLFTVEVFRFTEIGHILLRTVLSSILTTFLILVSQFFVFRR